MAPLRACLLLAAGWSLRAVTGSTCPGTFDMPGHGKVSLIPTGWPKVDGQVPIVDGTIVPHMGGRAYFGSTCTAGHYDHKQYLALNLLGKTMSFTTDMSKSGCGCNAALYLVSMAQNTHPSECNDYYCDANNVCGESCAEIDIQEANQFAWHSTLHTSSDHSGVGKGYGGGDGWNGPRDFGGSQYGPGAKCIDTNRPFQVSVFFPTDAQGTLTAMKVTLTQQGKTCPLVMNLDKYPGMAELSKAIEAGMTPVVSYWSDDTMLWMDGAGADGQGPCKVDVAAKCPETVRFSNFSISSGAPVVAAAPAAAPAPAPAVSAAPVGNTCPGTFDIEGHGSVSLVNAKLNVPGQPAGQVEVMAGSQLVPHMTGRAYFADTCSSGTYSNEDYVALNLLGKTFRYTTDMSGAGCGCNAALYLVSMHQNSAASNCEDYYCDANNVCGESCAEIDIQEANQHAWHSTLHTAQDHGGVGGGYGGGSGWNGPRDFGSSQYGPGAKCIDTTKPFQVAVSFPTDASGVLQAMSVELSQEGSSCPITVKIDNYPGMGELSKAIQAGMTPVLSYWAADDMLWMDGKGADGQGPCSTDSAAACSATVKFYGFSIAKDSDPAPAVGTVPAPTPVTPLPAPIPQPVPSPAPAPAVCSSMSVDCSATRCCRDAGMQCYAKNEWWAICKETCTPGVDFTESKKYQTPWSCKALGSRAPQAAGAPADEDVEVVIRVKASDLPAGWGAGTAVSVETSNQEIQAEVVSVPSREAGGVASFFTALGWVLLVMLLVIVPLAGLGALWYRRFQSQAIANGTNPPGASDAAAAAQAHLASSLESAQITVWAMATALRQAGGNAGTMASDWWRSTSASLAEAAQAGTPGRREPMTPVTPPRQRAVTGTVEGSPTNMSLLC